jgi:hypothetical protein
MHKAAKCGRKAAKSGTSPHPGSSGAGAGAASRAVLDAAAPDSAAKLAAKLAQAASARRAELERTRGKARAVSLRVTRVVAMRWGCTS